MASAVPTDLRPMKAVSGDLPGADEPGWVYEVKWDGMRILARCAGGATTLRTSNGLDATERFPELAGLAEAVGVDAVLDGEVVAIDVAGRPDFGLLQGRMHLRGAADIRARAAAVPVSLALFDLLWLDGHDTCALPWRDRRPLLERLVAPSPSWRVPAVHDDGAELLAVVEERGMEGVVAKRRDSPYLPGKRSPAWRKVKVRRHQEVVVGGWWPGEGNRSGRLGSLLVGVHDPGEPGNPLRYAGRVGTGFDAAALADYEARLAALAVDRSPFEPPPPPAVARRARWVRPELVIEVAFGEWTGEGVLRHPSHLGRRIDKDPGEVVREG
jgi:bifunctional non-homologous end joining protein LigD